MYKQINILVLTFKQQSVQNNNENKISKFYRQNKTPDHG